ncbi:DUF928 domain-containing protein [Leptothermofonsia sp. ETS-13]|uniref:DUF928 domain-containing protein n=1 Tax=Leptothermofonsia sp. ETS-13 TaxID=3035696 RepID=UPI003BA10C66
MKCPRQSMRLITATVLALFNTLYFPSLLVAQGRAINSLQFKMPSPPSRGTPIGRYRGGASRGSCPQVELPLTALVPFEQKLAFKEQGEPIINVWGLTVSEHPTFWFYVPYENGSTYLAEFVLQDEDEVDVYRSAIALSDRSGIVSVQMPSTAPALELNKPYHWFFKIYCNQNKKDAPIFVEGMVQRVSLGNADTQQIEPIDSLAKADFYAQKGIWYDTVTTLANLRYSKPTDPTLTANWTSLLQSIGLKDVALAPLIKCCQPK